MDRTSEQYLLLCNEVEEMKKTIVYWRQDRGHYRTNFRINGKRIYQIIPLLQKHQKTEAVEWATQLYLQYMRGEVFDECKTTFREMSETYFETKNLKSEKNKRYRLETIYKFIGDKTLDKISYIDYDDIRKHLKNVRKVRNQSVNSYMNDITCVLNLAKQQRRIKDFPDWIKLDDDPPSRTPRALTMQELDKIRSVLPDYLKDPFEFAWRTGLRRANIVGLQRKHIKKKDNGLYTISFSKDEMKGGVAFRLPLNQEETEIIDRNVDMRYQFIFRRKRKVNGTDLDKGLGDFKKSIITARKKCGFHWTWHWLRHTCTSRYAHKMTDKQLNKLMAWSPNSRMSGNYTHLRDNEILEWRQQDAILIDNHMTTKTPNSQ